MDVAIGAVPGPPVLNHKEAAAYIRRTPKALYALVYRGGGPDSFKVRGRRVYRQTALDAWLSEAEQDDRYTNRDLDPTLREPEPRRTRVRRPAVA